MGHVDGAEETVCNFYRVDLDMVYSAMDKEFLFWNLPLKSPCKPRTEPFTSPSCAVSTDPKFSFEMPVIVRRLPISYGCDQDTHHV